MVIEMLELQLPLGWTDDLYKLGVLIDIYLHFVAVLLQVFPQSVVEPFRFIP